LRRALASPLFDSNPLVCETRIKSQATRQIAAAGTGSALPWDCVAPEPDLAGGSSSSREPAGTCERIELKARQGSRVRTRRRKIEIDLVE
jgi:hypothetical protein